MSTSNVAKPTCITCKLLFESNTAQRDHHKTDLHRFNLKRKVANLPPVTEEAFLSKVAALELSAQESQRMFQCTLCRKNFQTDKAFQQHVISKSHQKQASKRSEVNPLEVTTKAALAAEQQAHIEKLNERTEDEIIQEKLARAKHLAVTECLFCPSKAESLSQNLEHMTAEHSFFLPDLEYCVDLEGLIKYLGQKVSVGCVCLYCLKEFQILEGCQQHMRDQAHCRLRYDEQDEDEYFDYYDFSSTYDDPSEVAESDLESDPTVKKHKIELADLGHELVLPDGRTLGHREFAVYYRQKFRRSDQSEAVIIGKLMAQYRAIGYHNSWHSSQNEVDRKSLKQQQRSALRRGVNSNKLHVIRPQVIF